MDISDIPLWAWGLAISLVSAMVGAVLAGGWRLRMSNDLLGVQQDLRLLQTKSEHQHFGVTDLKLRIRESRSAAELVQTEIQALRNSYESLDADLAEHRDNEVALKQTLVEQQLERERLNAELADWKARLANMQRDLDSGETTEAELKRELSSGITALCEISSSEMKAVQQILSDCGHRVVDDALQQEPEKVIGLLGANVELLENQLRYWQDLATSLKTELADLKAAQANGTAQLKSSSTPSMGPQPKRKIANANGTSLTQGLGPRRANHRPTQTVPSLSKVIARKKSSSRD